MSGGKASKLKLCPRRTLPLAVIISSSGSLRLPCSVSVRPRLTSVLNTLPNHCFFKEGCLLHCFQAQRRALRRSVEGSVDSTFLAHTQPQCLALCHIIPRACGKHCSRYHNLVQRKLRLTDFLHPHLITFALHLLTQRCLNQHSGHCSVSIYPL